MILSINKTLLKYYFKSVTHVFFDVHVTKNYVQTFKEDLCHALIVEKSFLHQILSTIAFKSGEIPSSQESNHSIIGPIQLSHFPKRGQIWQHTHSHITWKMVVLSKKTHFGGIKMFGNSSSNIDLKNILPITKHLASRKDVSVDFFSHLCRQPLHTFMRIKVTTMKRNFTVFTRWINKKDMSFLNFSKKTHGLPVYQSTQFSHLECF